jgi:hypothetical protein
LTLRHVSFRPQRTSVFPLIVVPPVLHTMLLLTEGRAGEVWEFSNKQCPVGYRGALDAEVLSHCSLFPVSAYYWLVSSSSLVPFITATFHLMPVTHICVLLARLLCTAIWTPYLLSAVLCGTSVVRFDSGLCNISLTTFDVRYQRGTSELTRGELPATRAKQELCIFALSFHLLPCSPESATILIQPWPSGSILLSSSCKVSDSVRCVVAAFALECWRPKLVQ